MKRLLAIAIMMLLVPTHGPALGGYADDPQPTPSTQPTSQPTSQPATQPAEPQDEDQVEAKEPKDRYLVVTNAEVHTVSGPVIFNATIVCKNGRIHAVGPNPPLPVAGDDVAVETLDAGDHPVYPGLVAAQSTGVLGAAPSNDTTNLHSLYMTLGLAGGLTTAVTGDSAAKLTYGSLEDHVVRESLFVPLRYSASSPDNRRILRADLDKVRQYIRDVEAYNREKATNPDAKEPDKGWLSGKHGEYYALLSGAKTAVCEADAAYDILQVCELAEQYGIRMVIRGASEGWTVAREMSRAKVSAIITPRRRRDPDSSVNRPTGWSIANASRLYDAGVPIAIVALNPAITLWGVAGRDLLHLNLEAAMAVRGGLSNKAALEAITLGAARILGVDHRVGSIEPGKDADLVICDGDILHYMTQVQYTIVNGRIVYDKSKVTLFEHIRPDGDRDAPPPDDYWPRQLGADVDSNGLLTR